MKSGKSAAAVHPQQREEAEEAKPKRKSSIWRLETEPLTKTRSFVKDDMEVIIDRDMESFQSLIRKNSAGGNVIPKARRRQSLKRSPSAAGEDADLIPQKKSAERPKAVDLSSKMSVACLVFGCCSLFVLAMYSTINDSIFCERPGLITLFSLAAAYAIVLSTGMIDYRRTSFIVLFFVCLSVAYLPDHIIRVHTDGYEAQPPDMGVCAWYDSGVFGRHSSATFDCSAAGPYPAHVSTYNLSSLSKMDATHAIESSRVFPLEDYFAKNLGTELRQCDVLLERILCSVMLPRCSFACAPLRTCRSVCLDFYEGDNGKCRRTGLIQNLRDNIQQDSRELMTEDAFQRNFLASLYLDIAEDGCSNDALWSDDADACDDRTVCGPDSASSAEMACVVEETPGDADKACTHAAQERYEADRANNRPAESTLVCSPKSGYVATYAILNLLFAPVFLCFHTFVFSPSPINAWNMRPSLAAHLLSLFVLVFMAGVTFAFGIMIESYVIDLDVCDTVECNKQQQLMALACFVCTFFALASLANMLRPPEPDKRMYRRFERDMGGFFVPIERIVFVTCGAIFVMMGVCFSILDAYPDEAKVLAFFIQAIATVMTIAMKLLQMRYPNDFGLSGRKFWINHFSLETGEIAVQLVNIAILIAPEKDLQVLMMSSALLALNFVVTPLLLMSRKVYINKTLSTAFDSLLDIVFVIFNAAYVVRVGSITANSGGVISFLYPAFMCVLLWQSIGTSYAVDGGPDRAHRRNVLALKRYEVASEKRDILSAVEMERFVDEVEEDPSSLDETDAALPEQDPVTKSALALICFLGVAFVAYIFSAALIKDASCASEYGSCLVENSRPRVYFPYVLVLHLCRLSRAHQCLHSHTQTHTRAHVRRNGIFAKPACSPELYTSIDASSCDLTTTPSNLDAFVDATSFDVSGNRIDRLDVPRDALPRLVELDIASNEMRDLPLVAFRVWERIRTDPPGHLYDIGDNAFERVDWSDSRLTTLCGRDSESERVCRADTECVASHYPHPLCACDERTLVFNVSANNLTDVPVEFLIEVAPRLEHVDLSRNRISVLSTQMLNFAIHEDTAYLSYLKHLDLSYNHITDLTLEWGFFREPLPILGRRLDELRPCYTTYGGASQHPEYGLSTLLASNIDDDRCCDEIARVVSASNVQLWQRSSVPTAFGDALANAARDRVCDVSPRCGEIFDDIAQNFAHVTRLDASWTHYERTQRVCGTQPTTMRRFVDASHVAWATLSLAGNPIQRLDWGSTLFKARDDGDDSASNSSDFSFKTSAETSGFYRKMLWPEFLGDLDAVESLDLSNNDLGHVSLSGNRTLTLPSTLRILDISGNTALDANNLASSVFEALANTRIEYLDVSVCGLGAASTTRLGDAVRRASGLRLLDVAGNVWMEDAFASVMGEVASHLSLTHLYLGKYDPKIESGSTINWGHPSVVPAIADLLLRSTTLSHIALYVGDVSDNDCVTLADAMQNLSAPVRTLLITSPYAHYEFARGLTDACAIQLAGALTAHVTGTRRRRHLSASTTTLEEIVAVSQAQADPAAGAWARFVERADGNVRKARIGGGFSETAFRRLADALLGASVAFEYVGTSFRERMAENAVRMFGMTIPHWPNRGSGVKSSTLVEVMQQFESASNAGAEYLCSDCPSDCDASHVPPNGNRGNCPQRLNHGERCQITCDTGYSVSGSRVCMNGQLLDANCFRRETSICDNSCVASHNGACDDGREGSESHLCPLGSDCADCGVANISDLGCHGLTPPRGGDMGECHSFLASGEHCRMSCNGNLTLSGRTFCDGNMLKKAACYDTRIEMCENTCTSSSNGRCDDQDLCEYGTDCSDCGPRRLEDFKCDVTPPDHGSTGHCPSILADGESCVPACDEGYTLHGRTVCDRRTLRRAVCFDPETEICEDDCLVYDESSDTFIDDGLNRNGVCDDGFHGSESTSCRTGADCLDCGARPKEHLGCPVTVTTIENGRLVGDCTHIAHRDECQVVCDAGYEASNMLICDGIRLKYASCFDPDIELCSNTCTSSFDGNCDDGFDGEGSCGIGTDCGDCGIRSVSEIYCSTSPPQNGNVGTCPQTLPDGDSCTMACDPGFNITDGGEAYCAGTILIKPQCYASETELCSNDCDFSNNGRCEDGFGGGLPWCSFGQDCADCDVRLKSQTGCDIGDINAAIFAPTIARNVSKFAHGDTLVLACVDTELTISDDGVAECDGYTWKLPVCFDATRYMCSNSAEDCDYLKDQSCDDGGTGSDYSVCDLGTDCSDCGPRLKDSCNLTEALPAHIEIGDCPEILYAGESCEGLCPVSRVSALTQTRTTIVRCSGHDVTTASAMCFDPSAFVCSTLCDASGDDTCDDGGEGSTGSSCGYGTDCVTCGLRPQPDLRCYDTSQGEVDDYGDGCALYDANPYLCSGDYGLRADEFCCGCGGGCTDLNETCAAYVANTSACGESDDDAFIASRDCCACGGGETSTEAGSPNDDSVGYVCVALNFELEDAEGYDCSGYDGYEEGCGYFDTQEGFRANSMCCECGGGYVFQCEDTSRDLLDADGDGCDYYLNDPLSCGYYDTSEFVSSEICCACGGGFSIASPTATTSAPRSILSTTTSSSSSASPTPISVSTTPASSSSSPTSEHALTTPAPSVPPTGTPAPAPTPEYAPTTPAPPVPTTGTPEPAPTPAPPCTDSDDGATDASGDDCTAYDGFPEYCGHYDTDLFTSAQMCCACEAHRCQDMDYLYGYPTDAYDFGCADYVGYEEYCGWDDDDDFQAEVLCCACGGGRAV